jgi:hypothetical protein
MKRLYFEIPTFKQFKSERIQDVLIVPIYLTQKIIIINGVKFRDVTNETIRTANRVMNYEEALAYTKGEYIVTSGGRKSN